MEKLLSEAVCANSDGDFGTAWTSHGARGRLAFAPLAADTACPAGGSRRLPLEAG